MELKDYTTEELKEELKRRRKAERSSRANYINPENHWLLFTATVVRAQKGLTRNLDGYVVDSEELSKCSYNWVNKHRGFPLVENMFRKKDRPQEGDTVEMRARKYADGRIGYMDAKITRVIAKCSPESKKKQRVFVNEINRKAMYKYMVRDIPEKEEGEPCVVLLNKPTKIRFVETEGYCSECCFVDNALFDCAGAKCTRSTRKDGKAGVFKVVEGFCADRGEYYKELHRDDYKDLLDVLYALPDKKYIWKEDEDDDDGRETPVILIMPCDWDMHPCDFEVFEAFVEEGKVKLRGSVVDSFDEQIIDDVLGFLPYGQIYAITENIQ